VPTYYEVLGVPGGAAHDVVRRAYLERARRLHPDRAHGLAPRDADESSRRMQEVNEAWRILGDPVRRAAYDRSLAAAASPTPPTSPVVADPSFDTPVAHPLAEPGDLGISIVRMVPWIAVAVVLGAIFVFTAFAGPSRTVGDLEAYVGDCVSIDRESSVTSVPCASPNDGTVVQVVTASVSCPSGSTSRRVEPAWLCIAPATVP